MRLIVALLCSIFLASSNTPLKQKAQQGVAEKHSEETQAPTNPSRPDERPCKEQSGPEFGHSKQSTRDWIDKTMAISTLGLAIFTLLMAGVIYYQLEAARLSERAWIIGNPEFNPFKEREIQDQGRIILPVGIKNVGKSPARIVEASIVLKKLKSLHDLPQKPSYTPEQIIRFNNMLLVPRDSFLLTAPEVPISPEEYFDLQQTPPKLFLCAYGFVRYKDVFDKKRETAFCHRYLIMDTGETLEGGFQRLIDAPLEYNKAT